MAALAAMLVLVAAFVISHIDFAPWASRVATARLGRAVSIERLRIGLGPLISIDLAGLSLANVPGGSRPRMIEIADLHAVVGLWSLLRGDPVIRSLSAGGVRIILEHGDGDRPNWRLGAASALAGPAAQRRAIPIVLGVALRDAELDYRTSSGNVLRTTVDSLTAVENGPDAPVTLSASGAYNQLPFKFAGTLAPATVLRDGQAPYGLSLRLDSGKTIIAFEGTAADPLSADGVAGRMILNAPDLGDLPTLADIPAALDSPVVVAGMASRQGGLWRLSEGAGTFDGHPLQVALDMREGTKDAPDVLSVDARFTTLDLGGVKPGGTGKSSGSIPLVLDPAPGVSIDAHITAAAVAYRGIDPHDLDVTLTLRPGTLSIDPVTMAVAGGTARSRITVTNEASGAADVAFDGALDGVDTARLAALLGLTQLPIAGTVASRVSGTMRGIDLADARDDNRVFAILSMTGGRIDRQLVQMASTDLPALFGRALFGRSGAGRLSCLLAILDLRNGQGRVAPLKLVTSEGTITGGGTYDALRDRIDLTIGTQSATTGLFALDIPVRISGPVSDYSIVPALGAPAHRLAAAADLREMPDDLQDFARANPCMDKRR